jgi:hypothetical protein
VGSNELTSVLWSLGRQGASSETGRRFWPFFYSKLNNKIEREGLRNGSDLSQLWGSLLWLGSNKSHCSEMREVRQYAEGKK